MLMINGFIDFVNSLQQNDILNIFLYLILILIKILDMKKLLISIGGLLIMAFVVVMFINATESKNDPTKAKAEMTKAVTAVPCPAACNHSAGIKTVTCDPEKFKGEKCTQINGKCDPATCPMHKEGQPEGGQMCSSSTVCKGACRTV